jgi:hypothetical protein
MHYRHILVVNEVGSDPSRLFAALRRWVPSAERVTVVAHQPTCQFAWTAAPAPPDHVEHTLAALDVLRGAARGSAPDVDIRLASELAAGALSQVAASSGVDLVAVDSNDSDRIPLVAELRRRARVAVLYVPDSDAAADHDRRMYCVGFSPRECWTIAAFLNAHTGRGDRAVLLSRTALSEEEVRQVRRIAGLSLDIRSAAAF